MNSKEIVESYLDRELAEVLGERGLENVIATETNRTLSGTETKILAALIQRRHNEIAMEKIRKNIALVEIRNVFDGQQIQLKNESKHDTEIEDFIVRLEKIYNKLTTECVSLEKEKKSETKRLEKLVETITKDDVLGSSNSESLNSITQEINRYSMSMLNKP